MPAANIYSSDVAFTPSVKGVQARKGSRRAYERVEAGDSWKTNVTSELKAAYSWPLRTRTDNRPSSTGVVRQDF
jgi:hypothetical protein